MCNLAAIDKPTRTLGIHTLAAAPGVIVAFNGLLAVRIYKPTLCREIELSTIRPPVVRSNDHIRGSYAAQVTVIGLSRSNSALGVPTKLKGDALCGSHTFWESLYSWRC